MMLTGRVPEAGISWLIVIFSILGRGIQRFVKGERAKDYSFVLYVYCVLQALLMGKVLFGNDVSETVLVTSMATTAMIGIRPGIYAGMVLVSSLVADGIFLQAAIRFALEMREVGLTIADNFLLGAFLVGVSVVLETYREKDWEEEKRKEKLYRTDYLTQVYNRMSVEAYFNSLEVSKPCAVIYCDLDNFKKINDVFGHDCGDETLCKCAKLLENTFEKNAMVARLGGDEFLVVVEDCDVETLLTQVRKVLGAYPMLVRGKIAISFSMGIAIRDGGSVKSYNEICREADLAMYEAKRRGKCRGFLYKCALAEGMEIVAKENDDERKNGENEC